MSVSFLSIVVQHLIQSVFIFSFNMSKPSKSTLLNHQFQQLCELFIGHLFQKKNKYPSDVFMTLMVGGGKDIQTNFEK